MGDFGEGPSIPIHETTPPEWPGQPQTVTVSETPSTVSSSQAPDKRSGPVMSRSGFFKALFGAGAVGILTAANKETPKAAEYKCVEVDSGKYYGIYENHTAGIRSEQIPPTAQVVFRESIGVKDIPVDNPTQVLSDQFTNYTGTVSPRDVISPTIQQYMIDHSMSIAFGDVMSNTLQDQNHASTALETGIGVMAAVGTLGTLKRDKDAPSPNTEEKHDGPTRRALIRTGFLGLVSAWTLSPAVNYGLELVSDINKDSLLNRVLNDFNETQTTLHPENGLLTFRSLLFAMKLYTLGEILKQQNNGQKPEIAFWVGNEHRNIELFLKLGQDKCQQLLNWFLETQNTIDPSFLPQLVAANGGIEDLSSIVTMPVDTNPFTASRNTLSQRITVDRIKNTFQKVLG